MASSSVKNISELKKPGTYYVLAWQDHYVTEQHGQTDREAYLRLEILASQQKWRDSVEALAKIGKIGTEVLPMVVTIPDVETTVIVKIPGTN